jgi:hypothetical protein
VSRKSGSWMPGRGGQRDDCDSGPPVQGDFTVVAGSGQASDGGQATRVRPDFDQVPRKSIRQLWRYQSWGGCHCCNSVVLDKYRR